MKHAKRNTKPLRSREPRPFPADIPPEIDAIVQSVNKLCTGKNAGAVVIALGLLFGEGVFRGLETLPNESDKVHIRKFLREYQDVVLTMLRRYSELDAEDSAQEAGE